MKLFYCFIALVFVSGTCLAGISTGPNTGGGASGVSSIIAGSGISVNTATGDVTVTATGSNPTDGSFFFTTNIVAGTVYTNLYPSNALVTGVIDRLGYVFPGSTSASLLMSITNGASVIQQILSFGPVGTTAGTFFPSTNSAPSFWLAPGGTFSFVDVSGFGNNASVVGTAQWSFFSKGSAAATIGTNGILTLNGFGTNTTLANTTINGGSVSNSSVITSNFTTQNALFIPTNTYNSIIGGVTNISGVGTNNNNYAVLTYKVGFPHLKKGDQFNFNTVDQYWIVDITNLSSTVDSVCVHPPMLHTYASPTNLFVSPAAAQWNDNNGNYGMSIGGDGDIQLYGFYGNVQFNSAGLTFANASRSSRISVQDNSDGFGPYLWLGGAATISGNPNSFAQVCIYPTAPRGSLMVMPNGVVSVPSGFTNNSGSVISFKVPTTVNGLLTASSLSSDNGGFQTDGSGNLTVLGMTTTTLLSSDSGSIITDGNGNMSVAGMNVASSGIIMGDDGGGNGSIMVNSVDLAIPGNNKFLVGGASGLGLTIARTLATTDMPTGVPRQYRSGQQAIANLATSQAVTFSSAMSTASYSVSLTADGTLAGAVGFGVTSKSTTGFTITLSAGIAGGVTVDYIAIPNL